MAEFRDIITARMVAAMHKKISWRPTRGDGAVEFAVDSSSELSDTAVRQDHLHRGDVLRVAGEVRAPRLRIHARGAMPAHAGRPNQVQRGHVGRGQSCKSRSGSRARGDRAGDGRVREAGRRRQRELRLFQLLSQLRYGLP